MESSRVASGLGALKGATDHASNNELAPWLITGSFAKGVSNDGHRR